ncbi:hypothetical protein ACFWC9_41195 [Streptomyces goshikiensis]|uniref:hypothetical protein n=1 Tax=Streptomyces goshikiensis TaxID=1942 RepID=UPI0036B23FE9
MAVTVRDGPNEQQRPYAFVITDDFRLWVNWWDGSKWNWSAQGAPSGRLIPDSVGVVTMKDDPNAFTRPYVFVIGDDSKLYLNWWDGKAWHCRPGHPARTRHRTPRRSPHHAKRSQRHAAALRLRHHR